MWKWWLPYVGFQKLCSILKKWSLSLCLTQILLSRSWTSKGSGPSSNLPPQPAHLRVFPLIAINSKGIVLVSTYFGRFGIWICIFITESFVCKTDDTTVGVRFNSSFILDLVAIGSENNSPRVVDWMVDTSDAERLCFRLRCFPLFCQLSD